MDKLFNAHVDLHTIAVFVNWSFIRMPSFGIFRFEHHRHTNGSWRLEWGNDLLAWLLVVKRYHQKGCFQADNVLRKSFRA